MAFRVTHRGLLCFLSASGALLRSASSFGLGISSYEAAFASASVRCDLSWRVAGGFLIDHHHFSGNWLPGVVYGLSNRYHCPHLRAEDFPFCDSACLHQQVRPQSFVITHNLSEHFYRLPPCPATDHAIVRIQATCVPHPSIASRRSKYFSVIHRLRTLSAGTINCLNVQNGVAGVRGS